VPCPLVAVVCFSRFSVLLFAFPSVFLVLVLSLFPGVSQALVVDKMDVIV